MLGKMDSIDLKILIPSIVRNLVGKENVVFWVAPKERPRMTAGRRSETHHFDVLRALKDDVSTVSLDE